MKKQELAVLDANDAFYLAFTNHDMTSMQTLWSEQHEIVVIHPGWPPFQGRESVMYSWRQILTGEGSSKITCHNANATILGDVALVVCTELLANTELVATNTFVLEADRWRLVHHQAGPLPQRDDIHEGDILH